MLLLFQKRGDIMEIRASRKRSFYFTQNCAGARKKVIIWRAKEKEVKNEKAEIKVKGNKDAVVRLQIPEVSRSKK